MTRLCRFYGSDPQFICCSATIANPGELASTLIGRPVEVIDKSGAASGEKHIVFYNPPVVNKQLGVRKSVLQETLRISSMLVDNDISTIVFGKSRLTVEVLTRHLKERVKDPFGNAGRVRGYRGGYLPTLRREIERGLRNPTIETLNRIATALDISFYELIGSVEEVPQKQPETNEIKRKIDAQLSSMTLDEQKDILRIIRIFRRRFDEENKKTD